MTQDDSHEKVILRVLSVSISNNYTQDCIPICWLEDLSRLELCSQKKTQKSSSTRVYSIFEFDYKYSSLNSIIKYRFLYSSFIEILLFN